MGDLKIRTGEDEGSSNSNVAKEVGGWVDCCVLQCGDHEHHFLSIFWFNFCFFKYLVFGFVATQNIHCFFLIQSSSICSFLLIANLFLLFSLLALNTLLFLFLDDRSLDNYLLLLLFLLLGALDNRLLDLLLLLGLLVHLNGSLCCSVGFIFIFLLDGLTVLELILRLVMDVVHLRRPIRWWFPD